MDLFCHGWKNISKRRENKNTKYSMMTAMKGGKWMGDKWGIDSDLLRVKTLDLKDRV